MFRNIIRILWSLKNDCYSPQAPVPNAQWGQMKPKQFGADKGLLQKRGGSRLKEKEKETLNSQKPCSKILLKARWQRDVVTVAYSVFFQLTTWVRSRCSCKPPNKQYYYLFREILSKSIILLKLNNQRRGSRSRPQMSEQAPFAPEGQLVRGQAGGHLRHRRSSQ